MSQLPSLADDMEPKGNAPAEANDLIVELQNQLKAGYGFVPFIGAGFSAPSGAPLIKDLAAYLQRCICIALGLDNTTLEIRGDYQSWNPRTDQWPPLVDRRRDVKPGYWESLLFQRIHEMRIQQCKINDNAEWDLHTQRLKLYAEAYGAMQDWRTSLLFLSRLNASRRNANLRCNPLPLLGSPQSHVIDACFREVLRGRYPALGHRMLGVLAGALRIDLVLTINFDDLLEKAFEAARNPLQIFEVPADGSLPEWDVVGNVRALVKLHGGRSALRADYSLDEPPTQDDKDRFLTYLLSPSGRNTHLRNPTKNNLSFDRHLLMMGFSAADQRINALVQYACDWLHEEFKVYWICYSKADEDNISKLASQKPFKGRIKLYRKTQTGLFLLELYQRHRYTLPPLGSIFPSASRLTLPPLVPQEFALHLKQESDKAEAAAKQRRGKSPENLPSVLQFRNQLASAIEEDGSNSQSSIVVTSSDPNASGITSLCSERFQEIENTGNKMALWIEMNNVSSADNLYEILLESIYYRLGVEEWIPSTLGSSPDPEDTDRRRGSEIARLLRAVSKPWVIFLNARETPGANTEDEDSEEDDTTNIDKPNGWLDETSADRESACRAAFVRLITAVLSQQQTLLTVVLMARGSTGIVQTYTWTRLKHKILFLGKDENSDRYFQFGEKVDKAIEWIENSESKQRFLHALVLMQRPRLLSSIWSPAFISDESRKRVGMGSAAESGPSNTNSAEYDWRKTPLKWIDNLQTEKYGLLRYKPGGMIWLHSRCRQKLRILLRRDAEKADIHVKIASWYEKIADASEAPDAIIESAYHFCKGAAAYLQPDKQNFEKASVPLCRVDLERASAVTDAAAAIIRSNSYLIQTHGYSRGSCRHLERIAEIGQDIWGRATDISNKIDQYASSDYESIELERQSPELAQLIPPVLSKEDLTELTDRIHKSVRGLWISCIQAMRAIAREVGEDSKAYIRQRQVAHIHLGQDWNFCSALRVIKADDDLPRENLTVELAELGKKNESGEELSRFWRWMRWNAMLGIASRSYGVAQQALTKPECLNALSLQANYQDHDNPSRKAFCGQSERIEFLRMIIQSTELQLLTSSIELRLRQGSPKVSIISDHSLTERMEFAAALIRRGRKLAAKIRDRDTSSDARDIAIANWCDARMLMHQSIIATRAGECDYEDGRFLDALGILGDAEAKLRISNPQRSRAELALIDLHRAEVRLRNEEIEGLNRWLKFPMRFPDPSIFDNSESATMRKASSAIDDAVRFLDRAENVLRERRRNVWWTTWFFERKLRAIAVTVLASCGDKGAPIPFLGLESAMRETDTEADRLLLDAIRMIRVDAYRMATIVEAYAACFQALVIRLCSDMITPRLPLRLNAMQKNLVNGVCELRTILARRKIQSGRNGALDENVLTYIRFVLKEVDLYFSSLDFSANLAKAKGDHDLKPICKTPLKRTVFICKTKNARIGFKVFSKVPQIAIDLEPAELKMETVYSSVPVLEGNVSAIGGKTPETGAEATVPVALPRPNKTARRRNR